MLSHPSRGPWFRTSPLLPASELLQSLVGMDGVGCFLDVFLMTFRDVLWRLVGLSISMPLVSPQSPWWKPPYLLAMYCHVLPLWPPTNPGHQASHSKQRSRKLEPKLWSWSKDFRGLLQRAKPAMVAGQPMATDVDILYASVGQIRHGFFGCAKRQRPQQILDLANRYGWGGGCHMLCTNIGDHLGFWELWTARMIKII